MSERIQRYMAEIPAASSEIVDVAEPCQPEPADPATRERHLFAREDTICMKGDRIYGQFQSTLMRACLGAPVRFIEAGVLLDIRPAGKCPNTGETVMDYVIV